MSYATDSADVTTFYDRSSAPARASAAAPARGPQIVIHAASGPWPTAGARSMVARRCVAPPPPGFAMAATAHCYRCTSPNATTACIRRSARDLGCGIGQGRVRTRAARESLRMGEARLAHDARCSTMAWERQGSWCPCGWKAHSCGAGDKLGRCIIPEIDSAVNDICLSSLTSPIHDFSEYSCAFPADTT